MSAARIAALEKKLADVEKRHGEAIARLSQFIAEQAGKTFATATQRHEETDRISMLVDELVPEATARVFTEWEKDRGARTGAKDEGPMSPDGDPVLMKRLPGFRLLAVLLLAVAAPLGADVVTISCREADGTLAPCARKLTGGSLGYHELISSAGPAAHTGPASYAPAYAAPVPIWGGGWGGSNGGHRGGGGHRAASSAPGAAPRSHASPHASPTGGGRTRGGRTR